MGVARAKPYVPQVEGPEGSTLTHMAQPGRTALGRAVMVVDGEIHEELQTAVEVRGHAHRALRQRRSPHHTRTKPESQLALVAAPSSARLVLPPMKYTTYTRYLPELADTLNLQALLDQLADFLLQSGFAGGAYSHPFWGEFGEDESDRSLDALRQAILQALMDSGQLTPEMLKLLRGESTGDAARDADLERQLSELLDKIVQKLIDEGYLNVTEAPKVPSGQQPLFGPGGMAKEAAQQVQFNLTEKGIDFLGYRTLKHLLGSIGKSSFGAHETEHLATGVEAEAVSKPYEYGDTLNLDVNATLTNALQREGLGVPINLEYDDLMVHQAEYRSSSATVLMLDCSHSMILYGEDRFTPAKKVALQCC